MSTRDLDSLAPAEIKKAALEEVERRKRVMSKIAVTAAGAAIALAALAGCSSATSADHGQAKASISALASVPGADAKQVLIRAGIPVTGTSAQQLAWFESMTSPVHGKANRKALEDRLKIAQNRRPAFRAALLDLAKKVIVTHEPVQQGIDDLANIVAKYAGTGA